jgi:hypothetical protein
MKINGKNVALTLALILATPCLSAQTTASAPLPSQLAAAKTIFISNVTKSFRTTSDEAYSQFYMAVQQLNRFTIVTDPAQADLIVELGLGDSYSYPNAGGFYATLRIVDPKSHVTLWSVSETSTAAGRQATIAKNAQTAINNLATDLQTICAPQPSATH